jgi:hypothetical protein
MDDGLKRGLERIGAASLAAFPAVLIAAFALHFAGEFTTADFLRLRLVYVQPSPERFLEVFRAGAPTAFVLPHLLVYLALPLLVPAVAFLAAKLLERAPRVAVAGAATALAGLVYMGGVFGAWLAFEAIGRVQVADAAPLVAAVAALIRGPMLRLTSALAGLSLAGVMVLAAGLLVTGAVPRRRAALVLAGNAIIVAFMDIDNLMMLGAALWLAGALPFLRAGAPAGAAPVAAGARRAA